MWEADKRLLPRHLRGGGDNSRTLRIMRLALRAAAEHCLNAVQREHLRLYYGENKTKTEIGAQFGVGSSTVCKTLRAAEKAIQDYTALYMSVCERVRQDILRENDNIEDIRGEIYAKDNKRHCRYD